MENLFTTLKGRMIFIAIVTMLFGLQLFWEHSHGGVNTHYLLHRQDLPGFSNWWGIIVLPLLTWILLYLIHRRFKANKSTSEEKKRVIIRFLAGLLFGILMSILFPLGYEAVQANLMLGVILLSFFIPLFFRSIYLVLCLA